MQAARQRAILRRLSTSGMATTDELAVLCAVSVATVRRDLMDLEDQGVLRRVHGGAVLERMPVADSTQGFTEVAASHAADKEAVAARAAQLVSDGDCVLLDIGTTTMLLARELRRRPVTVVTASLAVLDVLRDDPEAELVLLGGMVRRGYHSLVGSLTEDALRQIRAATCFLGASGVDADGAVLDTTMIEVPVKRALLSAALRRVLLVDGSKFPGAGSLRVCGPERLDVVVTTGGADPATLDVCRAAGAEVLLA